MLLLLRAREDKPSEPLAVDEETKPDIAELTPADVLTGEEVDVRTDVAVAPVAIQEQAEEILDGDPWH